MFKKLFKIIAVIGFIIPVYVFAAPFLPFQGGTGTSTKPTLGQLLMGNSSGTYDLVATSSLGVGGTPAGSTGEIQYNNGGVFGATSSLYYSTTTGQVNMLENLMIGGDTLLEHDTHYGLEIFKDIDDFMGMQLVNFNSGTSAETNIILGNDNPDYGAYSGMSYTSTGYDNLGYGLANKPNAFSLFNTSGGPIQIIAASSTGYIQFGTGGWSGEAARITETGAFGIGSTSPIARLVVTNPLSNKSLIIEDQASDPTPFYIDQTGNTSLGADLFFSEYTDHLISVANKSTPGAGAALTINSAAGNDTGVGGNVTFTTGPGGNLSGFGTAPVGGTVTYTTGKGGDAPNYSTTTNTGGKAGNMSITTGPGGIGGTSTSASIGGNGGDVIFTTGPGGKAMAGIGTATTPKGISNRSGAAGSFTFLGGQGGAADYVGVSAGAGGGLTFTGGPGGASSLINYKTGATGGSLIFMGGAGAGNISPFDAGGNGGLTAIQAGNAGSSVVTRGTVRGGTGGSISVKAADGGNASSDSITGWAVNGDGGLLDLRAGNAGGVNSANTHEAGDGGITNLFGGGATSKASGYWGKGGDVNITAGPGSNAALNGMVNLGSANDRINTLSNVGIQAYYAPELLTLGGKLDRTIIVERNPNASSAGKSLTLKGGGTSYGAVSVLDATPVSGGNYYSVNDQLKLFNSRANQINAFARVSSISATGGLKTVTLTSGGTGYTPGRNYLTLVQAGASNGVISVNANSSGVLTGAVGIVEYGLNYATGTGITSTGGGNNDAVFSINATTGAATGVTLEIAGSGYVTGTTFTENNTSNNVGRGAIVNISAVTNAVDANGGDVQLSGGISTGLGSSNIRFLNYPPTTSGGTDNTQVEQMTLIGATGNLGIGTTSPIGKFTVATTSNVVALNVDTNGILAKRSTFCELFTYDNTTIQSIPTGTTYTKSTTASSTNGHNQGYCQASTTASMIRITKPGIYRANGSFSFTADTNNVVFRGALFVEGEEHDDIHWKRKITTGADAGNASFTGFFVATSSTDVDFRVRHDNGGSVGLTIEYQNLNIEYIGEPN